MWISVFCLCMESACTVNIRLPARNHLGIEIVLENVLCGSLETISHAWKLFILVLKMFVCFCLLTCCNQFASGFFLPWSYWWCQHPWVSSTHFPQEISATLGSLGDPENPEMNRFSVWSDLDKILTNFIVRAAWGWARMMLTSMLTRANMAACRLHCRANPSDQARAGRAWWWGSRILASWRVWSLGVQTWAVGPIVGLLDLIHGLPTQTSSCRRGFLAAEGVQERKRAAPFASASAQVKLYSYVVVTCPSETDSFILFRIPVLFFCCRKTCF